MKYSEAPYTYNNIVCICTYKYVKNIECKIFECYKL